MAGKWFQQERCNFNKNALFTIIKQINTYQFKGFRILKLDSLYEESFQKIFELHKIVRNSFFTITLQPLSSREDNILKNNI